MAVTGAEPAVVHGARVFCAAESASTGPESVAADLDGEDDHDGIVVVAGAPERRACPPTPANKASGAKSMETNTALAGAALRGLNN